MPEIHRTKKNTRRRSRVFCVAGVRYSVTRFRSVSLPAVGAPPCSHGLPLCRELVEAPDCERSGDLAPPRCGQVLGQRHAVLDHLEALLSR